MALSYSDVNHLTDLVRRMQALEETVAAMSEGRDFAGEIQALKMRLGSLQSQINSLRRQEDIPQQQPPPPSEAPDDAA